MPSKLPIAFAGPAQFISISLIGGGAALPVIWLTTFVVDLRHALYSATLQPVARDWPLPWRVLAAFWLTDECFAVIERRLQTAGEADALPYYLGSAIFFYANWLTWTAVGALLGDRLPGLIAWKTGRTLTAVVVSFAVFGLLRWLA